ISRRLPRGFDGSDRRKSRSGRKRNRRKTETETATIHESDRSRVGAAGELEQDTKNPPHAQESCRVASQESRVILAGSRRYLAKEFCCAARHIRPMRHLSPMPPISPFQDFTFSVLM